MKKLLLLSILLYFSTQINAQISIGNGTSKYEAIPVKLNYDYTYSQVIYLQSEINAIGDITTLTWDFSETSIANSSDWTIYLGTTIKTEFSSSSDWIPLDSLTEVFSGIVTLNAENKVVVDISDFTYNNNSNLVIAVDENTSNYESYSYGFYCTSVTNKRGLAHYADNFNPDPANLPPGNYFRSYIANIILGGITQACPYPSDLAVDTIEATTSDVSWTSNSPGSKFIVEWKEASAVDWTDSYTTGINDTSYQITGLNSETEYEWRLTADCTDSGDGTSFVINGDNFVTIQTCPNPSGLTVGTIGETTADVSWTSNSPGSIFIVEWREKDSITWNQSFTTTVDQISYQITNLQEATEYEWRVSADCSANGDGNSYWVFGPLFTTLSNCPAPTNLTVNTVTSFTADVSWTSNSPGSKFIVEWKPSYSYQYLYSDTTSVDATSYQMTNLQPSTFYFWRVRSDCNADGNGYGVFVYGSYFKTDVACVKPSNLEVGTISTSTCNVSWTSNSPGSAFKVEWKPSSSGTWSNSSTTGIDETSYEITGLTEETEYNWRISADCTADGYGYSYLVDGPDFTTDCSSSSSPFNDDFENHIAAYNANWGECWTASPKETTSEYRWNISGNGTTPSSYTGPNGANSGSKFAYTESDSGGPGDIAELYSPTIDLNGLTSPELSFYYYMYGSSIGTLHVDIYDGVWNNDIVSIVGEQQTSGNDAWIEKKVALSAYTGTIQIRFRGERGDFNDGDISIDDFDIHEGPACAQPTFLQVGTLTDTTADLSWVSNSSGSTFIIEWKAITSNTWLSATTAIDATNYQINNLDSDTEYEWRITADCGGGNQSSTDNGNNFTTLKSCFEPTNLNATNITDSEADLSWTTGGAANWEIVVQFEGMGAPTGSGTSISNNPFHKTGLNPETDYEFYVRDDCGGGDLSIWSGPFIFTTYCQSKSIPYSTNFDYSESCWEFLDINDDNKGWVYDQTSCEGKGLEAKEHLTNNKDDWAFSPDFDLTSGTDYEVKFSVGSLSYIEKLAVYLMDSKNPNATNKILIYKDENMDEVGCEDFSVIFSAPDWSQWFIGYHAYSDANQGFIKIDNFSIDEAPVNNALSPENNNYDNCESYYIHGITGDFWHNIYANSGDSIIASINSHGQDLGTLTIEMRDASNNIEEYEDIGDGQLRKTLPKFYNFYSEIDPTNSVSIRLYFSDSELQDFNNSNLGSGVSNFLMSDLDITHYDGTNEDCYMSNNEGGTFTKIDNSNIISVPVDGGFYLQFDVSIFSEFTTHEPSTGAIPIELLYFSGYVDNSNNILEWETMSEVNTDMFYIDRSYDGVIWREFKSVKAAGDSREVLHYRIIDDLPKADYYYRLRIIDFDGNIQFSDIIFISRKNNKLKINDIYPNPNSGYFFMNISSLGVGGQLTLLNTLGIKVFDKKIDLHKGSVFEKVNIENLKNGMYLLILEQNNQRVTKRIIIEK